MHNIYVYKSDYDKWLMYNNEQQNTNILVVMTLLKKGMFDHTNDNGIENSRGHIDGESGFVNRCVQPEFIEIYNVSFVPMIIPQLA